MTNGNSEQLKFDTFAKLLQQARVGDKEDIGRLLQQHRNYLLLVATEEINPLVRAKVGPSDVVQESLLTAHEEFGKFQGDSKGELLAWLKQILLNDLMHVRRTYLSTQKRQVSRERQLQYDSSLDYPLVDQNNTPATNALLEDESQRLKNAMSKLPDDYQQVLRLHSWQQKTFDEVGEIMSRSKDAARKLWTRAILKLQEEIADPT